MAVTLDLLNTSNPFGSLLAYVYDATPSSPEPYELEGPNGCTYEPMSNTGIAIVRHTLGNSGNTNRNNFAENQFYSIMDSGVFP
jgi:hypothetical protein